MSKQALEVIAEMAAVYGVTLEPPALRVWKRLLDGHDPRDVEAAARAWLETEKWMPKPAEFIERVWAQRILRQRSEKLQFDLLSQKAMAAERSHHPEEMLKVAEELERAGRTCRAAALRQKAHALMEATS